MWTGNQCSDDDLRLSIYPCSYDDLPCSEDHLPLFPCSDDDLPPPLYPCRFLTVHPWWLIVEEPHLWQFVNHGGVRAYEGLAATSSSSSYSSAVALSVTLDRVHSDWVHYLQQYSAINYPTSLSQCNLLPMVSVRGGSGCLSLDTHRLTSCLFLLSYFAS
jgi:hypothetical protein